jgi:hypothetical protein
MSFLRDVSKCFNVDLRLLRDKSDSCASPELKMMFQLVVLQKLWPPPQLFLRRTQKFDKLFALKDERSIFTREVVDEDVTSQLPKQLKNHNILDSVPLFLITWR